MKDEVTLGTFYVTLGPTGDETSLLWEAPREIKQIITEGGSISQTAIQSVFDHAMKAILCTLNGISMSGTLAEEHIGILKRHIVLANEEMLENFHAAKQYASVQKPMDA